jgi:F0F1-type ATP synthase epsilon subunit
MFDRDEDKKRILKVKVASPYVVYYDEPALSISGVNKTGPFDILPGHHNFITLLEPCELVIRTRVDEQKIRINGGLMHVRADSAAVFLDV